MITPSFSPTATERVLPSMALDFTTASLDSRVTFTRSGNTATVTDSNGYVVGINANLPRFNYDPIALTCKGLLIEEARSNLYTYSEQFDNAVWLLSNASISANATTSPSNTTTAEKLIESATTTTHFLYRQYTTVATTVYTFSAYCKASERTFVQLTSGTNLGAYFNLSTGAVGTVSGGYTALISPAGNGWYRCSISWTAVLNDYTNIFLASANGTRNYAGNGTSGVFIWGAQLEVGAFPTSYIPTTTLAVTRNADVAAMTSTNFSSWYTATIGAAVVWAIPQTATGVRPLLQFDDTTALKIITLRGNVADPELYIVDTTAQAQIDAGTIVANTAYKLSGGWNTNNCAAAKDGGTVGTDVVATIPALTQLRIGSDGTNYASAIIQKVLYYPQRIINAEVQAISKL